MPEGTTPDRLAKRAYKLLRSTPLSGRLTATAALQAFLDAGLAEVRRTYRRSAAVTYSPATT